MYQALGEKRETYCDACFSGEYLIDFPKRPAAARSLRVVGT
jgi:amidophosphoribosyltransferase